MSANFVNIGVGNVVIVLWALCNYIQACILNSVEMFHIKNLFCYALYPLQSFTSGIKASVSCNFNFTSHKTHCLKSIQLNQPT